MKRYIAILFALAIMPVAINAQSQNSQTAQKPEKRSLRLLLEGDSDIAPYSFQELYKRGNEVGCEISFAHGLDDSYDARVVLTTGTGSEWCSGSCSGNAMSTSTLVTFAYGSAVVLMRDGKLLFTVSRSGSVRSLLIKELIDDFQVYYPTLKRVQAAPHASAPTPDASSVSLKRDDRAPAELPNGYDFGIASVRK